MKKNFFKSIIGLVLVGSLFCFYGCANKNIDTKNISSTDNKTSSEKSEKGREEIKNIGKSKYNAISLVQIKDSHDGFGTGSFISPDTVVTNKHVIDAIKNGKNKVVRVFDRNGKAIDLDVKELIFPKNEYIDVGIVKLMDPITKNKNLSNIKILKIADKDAIKKTAIGDSVKTVGYPGDKDYGTLWSSFGKIKELEKGFMSFNALIAGGASGSPIFNEKDEFIGFANAGTDDVENPLSFGFLIDEEIREFIEKNM